MDVKYTAFTQLSLDFFHVVVDEYFETLRVHRDNSSGVSEHRDLACIDKAHKTILIEDT